MYVYILILTIEGAWKQRYSNRYSFLNTIVHLKKVRLLGEKKWLIPGLEQEKNKVTWEKSYYSRK